MSAVTNVRKFMVGRQPIFDSKLRVRGYELLFRGRAAPRPHGDVMTADVLVHAGLDIGLEALVGNKLAFVNATRSFLVGEHEVPFSPRQAVIEILEGTPRDPEVLAGCRRLARAGYTLALDDYAWGADDDPFIELVSIIKVDLLTLTTPQLAETVKRLSAYGVELVAEKVETYEQLTDCQALGFDLYQGYLFSRPEVVEGRSLSASMLTCMRVLQELCDPATSARQVERIVQTDAALSYRFLRVAGAGAARGLFRRLRSVRDAVVWLGERRVRAWVLLMLLADAHEGCDEQLTMAIVRARMAELMAMELEPSQADAAFTVGLVSALDLLLHVSLPAVLEGLSLGAELQDALLSHTGLLGGVLSDVLAWEVGGRQVQMRSGLGVSDVAQCYVQAVAWATEVCEVLDLTG
jgi:EAL and modified HD-GYP domain-containing signal transduction protein